MLRHFLCVLGLWSCLLAPASAVNVLSIDEARQQMFPGATAWVDLPAAALTRAVRDVGRDPQVSMVAAHLVFLRVMQGDVPLGYFVTDSVIGKFEKIDYAVGLNADGTVRSVRVLKYRESHGHEVAEFDWLAQYEGGSAATAFRVGRDIDGITGATLSAVHLSDGVRRVTRILAALRAAGN